MKLGVITIGQSPRDDVMPEIVKYLPRGTEIVEKGALDGLDKKDIELMKPEKGDYVLVSRLSDGTSAIFAKRYIMPRMSLCIEELEQEKVDVILIICTGTFDERFHSNIPIIYPDDIIKSVVPTLIGNNKISIITPNDDQIEQTIEKWKFIDENILVVSASPYEDIKEIEIASQYLKSKQKFILLDCIGYTEDMKDNISKMTGSIVMCSRTLVGRVIGEIL